MTHNFKIGDVYKSFDYGSKYHRGWIIITDIVTPDRYRRRAKGSDEQIFYTFCGQEQKNTQTYRDVETMNRSLSESRLVLVDDPAEEAKIFLLAG